MAMGSWRVCWLTPYLMITAFVLLLTTGCASTPYQFGEEAGNFIPPPNPTESLPIEEGRPNSFIDTVGWIFGIPARVILWDRRVSNHDISEETRLAIEVYLNVNELSSVKLRLNRYDPFDELYRIVNNNEIGIVWKYTAGMISWLFYTLLPQRIFGNDNYSPFSNTLNLYSDVPAIALHEGGHAKDVAQRKYKGTYAVAYLIPFFSLYVEALASNDAISYLHAEGTIEEQKEGYRLLYPAYGTYVGGNVAMFLNSPWSLLAPAIGAIPGHITGRIKASDITEDGYNRVDKNRQNLNCCKTRVAPGDYELGGPKSASSTHLLWAR